MARRPRANQISPTVWLLKRFKSSSAKAQDALNESNRLARIWRGTRRDAPSLRRTLRGEYYHARGRFKDLRNSCTRIADLLLQKDAVTVLNSDDIHWVAKLEEVYGLLGVVRMRGEIFHSGGPDAFRRLADENGLLTVEE